MAKRRRTQTKNRQSLNLSPMIIVGVLVVLAIAGLVIFNQYANRPAVEVKPVDYPVGLTEDGQPFKGAVGAAVVIEEFADFRCSHCREFNEAVQAISEDYLKTGKAKLIFRNFAFLGPASISAAEASECALDQGPEAFWRYHDALFANQDKGEQVFNRSGLQDIAEQIGLDTGVFNRCLNSGQKSDLVQEEHAEGENRGVSSTPTLFINDERVEGNIGVSGLSSQIEALLAQ